MRATRIACLAATLALSCQESSGPQQTIHTLPIRSDETWTRSGSPHIVQGQLFILGGATLTIEAGATVLFDAQSSLTFGRVGTGTLRALGTAAAPITMRSLDTTVSPGAWIGLAFRSNTGSEMHYVSVSGCGSRVRPDSEPPSCLVLGNPLLPAENPTVLIDHVTVHDANGGAVVLWHDSRFGAGSAVLSVQNMHGYIAQFRAREAPHFPLGGTFATNDSNEVRMTVDTLRDSATWVLGVPWVVQDIVFIEGPNEPVLTIPAGSTILFRGGLVAGETAPGGLQIGTVGGPTVSLLPAGTDWKGLTFLANAVNSSISDADLESCGTEGNACINIYGSFSGGPAPSPVLKNVTIRHAIATGIDLTYGGRLGAGSSNLTIAQTAGNGFWDGTPFKVHMSPLSSIPQGSYTGNLRDVIWVYQLEIRQDETWPKYDVPYFIYGEVSVGDSASNPTLTIEPGVTISFANGVRFLIGSTAPGAVHAVGTTAEPITLRGETDTPGGWVGIYFGYAADSSSLFDHAIVDYAGGPDPAFITGSFHFYVDVGTVIHNSIIRNSAGCGIIIVNQPPWSTDFTAPALGNTFTNNAGGAVCGP